MCAMAADDTRAGVLPSLCRYVVEVLLLVPYVHLTIYHYIYAADLYDVLLIPLAESLKDLVVQRLHNWHYRIRALVDPDNMFLVKEK